MHEGTKKPKFSQYRGTRAGDDKFVSFRRLPSPFVLLVSVCYDSLKVLPILSFMHGLSTWNVRRWCPLKFWCLAGEGRPPRVICFDCLYCEKDDNLRGAFVLSRCLLGAVTWLDSAWQQGVHLLKNSCLFVLWLIYGDQVTDYMIWTRCQCPNAYQDV